MSGKGDSHLDEVFGNQKLPEHSALPERKVKPWHKPRKQWIRRHQWLKEIDNLCGLLNFKDGRPLRYLSLPGEDLLDVRVIRECCATRRIKLKYLGLNDDYSSNTPNTWLHIAANEVNGHAAIDRESIVIRDRFEQIADRESQAFHYVKEYGPFDVVNLDLCQSTSPLKPQQNNYYAALESLADHQIKTRPGNEPWLLLITSRAGGPWVLPDDMSKLVACVGANVKKHDDFAAGLEVLVPKGPELCVGGTHNWSTFNQPHFVSLFSVGLGKWLLKLLATAQPKWGVRGLGSYAYRIKAESPDMVSLAFLLEGYVAGPKDTVGLSSGVAVQDIEFDEKALALGLLKGVREIGDVDAKLGADSKLYSAMEKETVELLLSARYKPDIVRAGLKQFSRRNKI